MLSGFKPIVSTNSKILILGSMPGIASLTKIQYYAHPRNSFWRIIESLFSEELQLSYERRVELLHRHKIAVWDVLKNCVREGSLDSAIKKDSMTSNNFNDFFKKNPSICAVFFNGSKAQLEYKKQVLPKLHKDIQQLVYYRLPSTSPAMATLSPAEKLQSWSTIKRYLENNIIPIE